MSARRIRIGTRGSALAQRQAEIVLERLRSIAPEREFQVVIVRTKGDEDQESPLTRGTVTGWFTSALQDALLRREIDIAVHSYKDLPTARPDGLLIAAVPARDDPRDALVSRSGRALRELPAGAVVGTGSPRREVQLRAINPALDVRPIRGNIDTRLAKLDRGEYDAVVVAYAALRRLGQAERAAQVFGPEEILPAPAQGALAAECRTDDDEVRALLEAIDDRQARLCVAAERAFLARLGAGCSFPAAAHAELFGSTLKLQALIAPGGEAIRGRVGGPAEAAPQLGRALAEELLARAEEQQAAHRRSEPH